MGSHLIRELREQGHSLAVLHRGRRPIAETTVETIEGDRRHLPALRPAITAFAPDAVVDFIAYTAQDAWSLVQTFERGTRLVVLSSGDVYRAYDRFRGKETAPQSSPLNEESPLREHLFPYAALAKGNDAEQGEFLRRYEKILVEQLVRANFPRATLLRLPKVYGPGDRQLTFREWVYPMLEERPHIVLSEEKAEWKWSKGYVGNVARTIAACLTHPRTEGTTLNVADSAAIPELEWGRRIAALLAWKGRLLTAPKETLPTPLRDDFVHDQNLDYATERIEKVLGAQARIVLGEGLRATADYLAIRQAAGDALIKPEVYRAEDEWIAKNGA